MLNFSSEADQEDDITPFFNNEKECSSIFDDFDSSQEKNVFNMFNQDAKPSNNFSWNEKEQSDFKDSQIAKQYKYSKNSKQSIIDELDSYDFRERIQYLEQNLSENSEQYFQSSESHQKQNKNQEGTSIQYQYQSQQENLKLDESIVKEFKQSQAFKINEMTPTTNNTNKSQKISFQFKYRPQPSTNNKSKGFNKSFINLGDKRKLPEQQTKGLVSFKESTAKNKQIQEKQKKKVKDSKINQADENQSRFKWSNSFKTESKQGKSQLKKQKQLKSQLPNAEKNILKAEKQQNAQNHKKVNFNFSFNLKKSKASSVSNDNQSIEKNTDQIEKDKKENKIKQNLSLDKKLVSLAHQNKNIKEQQPLKAPQQKNSFCLKEELAKRQKRFTQKLRFQPKNKIGEDFKNRITLKPTLNTKIINKKERVQEEPKQSKNQFLRLKPKQQKNICPKEIVKNKSYFAKKEQIDLMEKNKNAAVQKPKRQQISIPNRQKSYTEQQLSEKQQCNQNIVRDTRDFLVEYCQKLDEIGRQVEIKKKQIGVIKFKYCTISSTVGKCNFILDCSQSHNISQTILATNQPSNSLPNQLKQPTKNQNAQFIRNPSIPVNKIRKRNIQFLS